MERFTRGLICSRSRFFIFSFFFSVAFCSSPRINSMAMPPHHFFPLLFHFLLALFSIHLCVAVVAAVFHVESQSGSFLVYIEYNDIEPISVQFQTVQEVLFFLSPPLTLCFFITFFACFVFNIPNTHQPGHMCIRSQQCGVLFLSYACGNLAICFLFKPTQYEHRKIL